MGTALMIVITLCAFGYDPPKPPQAPPIVMQEGVRVLDYPTLYRLVESGETVEVTSGLKGSGKQVECIIPGEPVGFYRCYLHIEKELRCNNGKCSFYELWREPRMSRLPDPKAMPGK